MSLRKSGKCYAICFLRQKSQPPNPRPRTKIQMTRNPLLPGAQSAFHSNPPRLATQKFFLKSSLKEKMAETPSFFVPPVRKMLSSHTFQISRRWHTQPPLPARGPGEAQRRATRWHFSEVRVPVAKGGTVCRYASHNKFPALNVQFNSLNIFLKKNSFNLKFIFEWF